MHQHQLQQRLASCSQASCSYTAVRPPVARSHAGRRSLRSKHSNLHLPSLVCRAQEDGFDGNSPQAAAAADDAEIMALDPRNDTVYDRMTFASNVTPDYEDPQWVEKVDDWEEFWYNQNDEDDDLDDEDTLSTLERTEASLERARKLVSNLGNLRKRADVEQMITGDIRPEPFYEDTYRTEEEMVLDRSFYTPDPNPDYDPIDLRALAEKRASRSALDAEWRRRQSLLARPYSFTLAQRLGSDARLTSSEFDWIREEWTHEQIEDLIVGSGKFVHPDKVQAKVLNPLLPMDFHNDVLVHVVPETEEFIEQIGHMATEEDIRYLQSAQEIQLHGKDFVDSTIMFEDPYGGKYVDAPPNPWADMQREEDARDFLLFNKLVEQVTSKQERREAAAAEAEAREAVGEDEGEESDYEGQEGVGGDDALMGEGFTAFYAADDESAPGLLYYEDELDGAGLSESDFVERDEAEEQEEEGEQGWGDGSS